MAIRGAMVALSDSNKRAAGNRKVTSIPSGLVLLRTCILPSFLAPLRRPSLRRPPRGQSRLHVTLAQLVNTSNTTNKPKHTKTTSCQQKRPPPNQKHQKRWAARDALPSYLKKTPPNEKGTNARPLFSPSFIFYSLLLFFSFKISSMYHYTNKNKNKNGELE